MAEYAKTPVNNVITVTSIATALRMDLTNKTGRGESHDFPEIFFVTEGSGYTTVNGTRHALKAGQMMIFAPNSFHGPGSFGGIVDIISFETATPLPQQYCDQVITLTGEQCVRLHELVQQAQVLFEGHIGVWGMVLKKHVKPHTLQRVKNKLELFLLDLMHPVEHYALQGINTVTDYMVKNIHRTLTVQEMSQELGMSISSLKRLVQSTCSKSPCTYFTDLKAEEAKWLILHTTLSITEISERLGFSSVHYFSRVFKQKTGKTPTQYKQDFF